MTHRLPSRPVRTVRSSSPRWLAILALALVAAPVQAQTAPAPGSREAMWPAPSAEDWAKPCLVRWQRSFEDAIVVSKETKKPILICVNMDGEIASEHYAGIRYRDPDIAKLYEPYVTVIASVYRHTPQDHDAEGRRIPCPRFGTVTCGEHIAIEPGLFDRFFEGERVAPRHIMVELDGAETYDVYYAFDTESVFRAIHDGIANRSIQPLPDARGDRPVLERVASRDVSDREAVEEAYANGDQSTRRALLQRAIRAGDAASVDLLRMAVFGFDLELSELARNALAQSSSPASLDLIIEALRVPMPEAERDALIAALDRIGESSPRARTLAAVQRGLGSRSQTVDVEGWARELRSSYTPAPRPEWEELQASLAEAGQRTRSAAPDPEALLRQAEAWITMALDPSAARNLSADRGRRAKFIKLLLEDARLALERAQAAGAEGPRLDGASAIANYYLGERETAFEHAVRATAKMEPGGTDWNTMAILAIFAEGRRESIKEAASKKVDWPAEWMTDVHDTYAILARHPYGTDGLVAAHHDFLLWMGAFRQASETLDTGLQRFPDSWDLHSRFRNRILRRRGVEALEPAYAELVAAEGASPNVRWFAGYAALVAAEFHRRQGDGEKAAAAYSRAEAHYAEMIATSPEARDGCEHYIALAIAGRARIALDADDLEEATELILASFTRWPRAAASLDGLGLSPVGTAKMLHARALAAGREDLSLRVQAGLDDLRAIDPTLLELPAFERGGPRRR